MDGAGRGAEAAAAGRGASPYLFLVLAMLFFSTNIIIGRAVHGEIPPVGLSIWRWTTASLIFLPFGLGPVRRQWPLVRARWKPFLGMAVAGMLLGNTVLYVALKYTTALNAGIVALSRPILILILSWIILGTAITGGQVAGTAIAMAGVFTIILRGDIGLVATLAFNAGDLLVLVSSLGVAFYQVLIPLASKGDLHPNVMVQVSMTLGAVILIPVYAFETAFVQPVEPSLATAAAVLAVAIVPSILAIWCLNRGVAAVGPSRASVFHYLTPVFIAVMAIAFLGEEIRPYHLVASALVAAGIVIATRKRRRHCQPRAGR